MALGDARRASGQAMEESRRAIGQNNETARRAIGKNNEAARRGIGAAMEASRRGESLQRDLNSLEMAPRKRQALSRVEQRGARPVTRGRGTVNLVPASGGTGGGIASPLTETTYAARTFWPETILQSTDGLLSFKVKPIKEITQTDDNDLEVKQVFANPAVTP
ncbi:hypothetical protein M2318_004840 [Metapseudomonas resinovorans]|uniref:hypothetical protein n=1 Tax=Metapseudomonas resinovorans TaxID=53412 RepID=UPI003D1B9167